MPWPPPREFRSIVRFSVLLWLPALLLELTRPFEISAFAISPGLRWGFLCSGAVCLGIGFALGSFSAVMVERESESQPVSKALEPDAATLSGFAGCAIAAISFVAALPDAQRWGLTRDVAPHYASLLLLLATALAGGLVSWFFSSGIPVRARARVALGICIVALLAWAFQLVTRFTPEASIEHVATLGFGALAITLLLFRTSRPSSKTPGLARLEFPLALIAPCLLIVMVDPGAATSESRAIAKANPSATNVLFIVIDTLRTDYSDLGATRPGTTPHLARAADARGTRFHAAYAAAPNTIPSIKAMFTGDYASKHGGETKLADTPPAEAYAMAEAFRDAGYETAGFTANGLVSGEGFEQGFSEYRSLATHDYFTHSYFLDRVLAGKRIYRGFAWMETLRLHKERAETMRIAAGDWLRRRSQEERESPFFLYLHVLDPHWPYYDREMGAVPDDMKHLDDPFSYISFLRLGPPDPKHQKFVRDPRMREMKARYTDEILATDKALGALLDDLEAQGLSSSTLIVIVGDHGEEFFEHNAFGHGQDVYNEEIHVPLVFLWPMDPSYDDMPDSIEQPVSLIDVFATLSELLELPEPPSTNLGRSLVSLLEGTSGTSHPPLLSESRDARGMRIAYRDAGKIVRFAYTEPGGALSTPTLEVFDAVADPEQREPLDLANPDIAAFVARARSDLRERKIR